MNIELKKQKDGTYSGIQKKSKQKVKPTIIKRRVYSCRHDDAMDAMAYALAGNNILKGEAIFLKHK